MKRPRAHLSRGASGRESRDRVIVAGPLGENDFNWFLKLRRAASRRQLNETRRIEGGFE